MSAEPPIVELEAKLMFLERTVEVLQETVRDQGETIDKLTKRIGELERGLCDREAEDEIGPQNDRPPHY